MRIIAGSSRGARIVAPKGVDDPADRRPRARGRLQPDRPGRRRAVLDLFAGSGAMGLEALSRGAERRISSRTTAPPAARSPTTSRSSADRRARPLPGRRGDAAAGDAHVRPRPRRPAVRRLGRARAEARASTCRACSRRTACSSSRPARAPSRRFRSRSARGGGTVPRGSPSSSTHDHRDLSRLVRPGHERPRRRDRARRGDLRPRRRRRRRQTRGTSSRSSRSTSASRSCARRSASSTTSRSTSSPSSSSSSRGAGRRR